MQRGQQKRTKLQWLNLVLKTIILVGVGSAFYFQVFGKSNVEDLKEAFFEEIKQGNLNWLVAAFLLLPLNYYLQAQKWKVAIKQIIQPDIRTLLKCVLAGTTLSFWTPAQIGDYGGRLIFLNAKERNWKVIYATGVGNIAQQVAVLTFGAFGLVYYLYNFSELTLGVALWIISIYAALLVTHWILFYNIDLFSRLLRRLPFVKGHISDSLSILKEFSNRQLSNILSFALLRLLVYSLQYYCLLQFFGIYGSFVSLFLLILADYAIQYALPIPPFLRLFFRGEIAITIWSAFSTNQLLILAASFGLFTLNILIPSLVGLGLLLNANILKPFDYEKSNNV